MRDPIRRIYDLNGLLISVVAEEPHHAGFLDAIFAPFAVAKSADTDWTITVRRAATIEAARQDTRHIWTGPLPEGLPLTLVEADGRQTLIVPDHFAISSVRLARSTKIDVTADGAKSIGGTAAFVLLEGIFAAYGRHLLHGACLVRSATDQAFALFAPSGTGKSTTALALARTGLELSADDALVLEKAQDGFYLWGIPRKVKVHRRTAELLPWLDPVLAAWSSDEQAIDLGVLDATIRLANGARRRASGAIVLLQPNPLGHRIESIAKVDALGRILADNLRRTPVGVTADTQAAFSAIANFIGVTPTVAVSVGPDPDSLTAESILSALETRRGD
jgi:hypothetical protein